MRKKPCPKGRELTRGPGNFNLRVPSQLVAYRFGHEKKADMAFTHYLFQGQEI